MKFVFVICLTIFSMLSISENFMDKKVIFKKIFVDGEIGTVRYKYRYQITII